MAQKTKVALGAKAYSFHDPNLGITLSRGETMELSSRQLLSRRIQQALNAGHLRIVQDIIPKYTDEDLDKLYKKILKAGEKGQTLEKIAKGYTLGEVTAVAAKHQIIADSSDTVETLIKALLEDASNE